MGVAILMPLWMHAQMFVDGDAQGTLVTSHVGGFLGQKQTKREPEKHLWNESLVVL